MNATKKDDSGEEVSSGLQPVAERPASHDQGKERLGHGCRPGPGVHHDDTAKVLLVLNGVAHSDGAAPILNHENKLMEIQALDEVFDGVRPTLAALSTIRPLMLITKGDLLHQASKLERSGLEDYFQHVEIVSEKTPSVYERILNRHGIDPARFMMVGNSLRSDILPVIDLGGCAAYIPAALNWVHEHADAPATGHERFFELSSIAEVVGLVDRLAVTSSIRGDGSADSEDE